MNSLGKTVHLRRLQNPESNRIFTVAMDHTPSYGLFEGLKNICEAVDQVAKGRPDAIMLMKGTAERCYQAHAGHIALIVKCSTLSPFHAEYDVWVHSVEEALQLGADAIAMAVTIGSPQQAQSLDNLAALIREAEQVGLPVIAHAYPNGELIPPGDWYSADQVMYASRLVMELGVDIVETFYTGSTETFAQVVEFAAPALVVAVGGPKLEKEADALRMAYDVVQAGAAGITFGRNIWESGNISGMMQALKHIVHSNGSVDEAVKILSPEESG
jgi:DhnA family fructose-bisphosphate aldolase class Ia